MPVSTRLPFALLCSALLAACGPGGPSDGADGPQSAPASAGPIPEGAPMPEGHPPISELPTGHPDVSASAGSRTAPAQPAADARTGTVLEARRSAGYTYALMDFDGEELWVAGPASPVEVGDEVTVSGLMGMTDFYARSLDRTFDAILFATTFTRSSAPDAGR